MSSTAVAGHPFNIGMLQHPCLELRAAKPAERPAHHRGAIGKEKEEHRAREQETRQLAGPSSAVPVVHVLDDVRSAVRGWLEAVCMLPQRKRAGGLDVGETGLRID